MSNTPEPPPVELIAAQLAALSERTALVVESTAGYRAQLEAAGMSPTAAEAMAVDYHRALIAVMMR